MPLWCTVALVIMTSEASSHDSCQKKCLAKVDCEIEAIGCLLDANRTREALVRLKPLVEQHPDTPAFARLLAMTYLADDNPFWAERALLQSLERNPDDCESRSWLAWVYIGQGDLDLAREIMARPRCPVSERDKTRWHILESHMAKATGNDVNRADAFEAIENTKEIYPEDKKMWIHLRSKENPGWIEPLTFRLEALGGYTSNARAGSPTDPSKSGAASALSRLDVFGRLVWPVSRILRPQLQANVKAHGLAAKETRELSYLDFSIQPGVILGGSFPRVLLTYKGNLLLINLEDKSLFYEAHRGEVEVETDFGLLIFSGAGRRLFHESGRTRTELDGGLGVSYSPLVRLRLLFALTGRYYWALGAPYDQTGVTGLVAGRVSIAKGFYGRLGATTGMDYYPNSGGERGVLAYGTEKKRLDFLIKQFEELWSPSLGGVRFGLRYEFTWRNSNADQGENNYDYMEHRIMAGLRFAIDGNPWGPRLVSSKEHVGLDYGIAKNTGAPFDEERIQDLLRQDEAARSGSSCVE